MWLSFSAGIPAFLSVAVKKKIFLRHYIFIAKRDFVCGNIVFRQNFFDDFLPSLILELSFAGHSFVVRGKRLLHEKEHFREAAKHTNPHCRSCFLGTIVCADDLFYPIINSMDSQ